MPESAAPHQSAAAARLRPSRNGSTPPLPVETVRVRRQRPVMLRMAMTQLRGMMHRIARRT
jgi:hypothetical protein